jgi:hypothetical protein
MRAAQQADETLHGTCGQFPIQADGINGQGGESGMNRRGFFAALAGLPLAPIALKADPLEGRRKKALAISSNARISFDTEWVECGGLSVLTKKANRAHD